MAASLRVRAVAGALSLLCALCGLSGARAQSLGEVRLSVKTAFWAQPFDAEAVLEGADAVASGTELPVRLLVNGVLNAEANYTVAERVDGGVQTITVAGVECALLGTCTVTMQVVLPDTVLVGSAQVQTIEPGVSLIPLLLVLLMALATQMVELSLATGVFVGAWIVTGSITLAFQRFLDDYLVNTLADPSHQFVILFTLFLSGLVGMIDKSGGILGLTSQLLKVATGPRGAQGASILAGCLIFFDDYASCLVLGFSFKPVFDALMVSREKLAFITDATSAPIASLSPLSSWVGFEVGLIQDQLDQIKRLNNGSMPAGLSDSGFTVFVQSIPYRYYPIFMLVLQLALAAMRFELGPMMAAERKVTVHRRTDGGDGAFVGNRGLTDVNAPHPITPQRWWNMVVPIAVLIAMIVGSMVDLGQKANAAKDPPNLSPTVSEIFEATDAYASLLYGTFASVLVVAVFFVLQQHRNGRMAVPTPLGCFRSSAPDMRDADAIAQKRPLLSVRQSTNAFIAGLQRVFPAIVVLVLAWAIGKIQSDVGCTRFFQAYIESNVSSTALPSIVFLFSSFMALATGTSWGTMAIVFPIVVVPSWIVSQSPAVVVATVAAVLSGAVMGDHCSPISDTTVLSALASDCHLMKHVWTQAPYAVMVWVWCFLIGTIPVANGAYSTSIAILLSLLFIPLTLLLLGAPIVNKTGRYDLFTEAYLLFCSKLLRRPDEALEKLRLETAAFCAAGATEPGAQRVDPDAETHQQDSGQPKPGQAGSMTYA